jgi:putative addiction module component (TIGR02574 family)
MKSKNSHHCLAINRTGFPESTIPTGLGGGRKAHTAIQQRGFASDECSTKDWVNQRLGNFNVPDRFDRFGRNVLRLGSSRADKFMANDLSQELLNDAMRLPDDQRAALAAALIESLDHGVDEDAEAAWSVEIARRLRDVQSGQVKTVPWPQARQVIAADEPPYV